MLIGIWVGYRVGIFGIYELFIASNFFRNYYIDSRVY